MNYMEEIMSEVIKKVTDEQNRIVKERLKEYLGYEVDLVKEKQRLFPRLATVSCGAGKCEIYWNDGTERGHRIVSFSQNQFDGKISDIGKFDLGFSYF